jgi:phosphinothricin acetyltransferase
VNERPQPIRDASPEDAAAIAAIYAPMVTDSPASFELEAPDAAEIARRIEKTAARYPWFVWDEGGVIGYAYATVYVGRPAYRWSTEVSIYLAPEARGRGIGRELLGVLLEELRARGFVNVIARIALPNPASVSLFESFGFEKVGVTPHIGFKFGRWHDVGEWQLLLAPLPKSPEEPQTPA